MTWVLLLSVTFFASVVQSATGFAFAMIVVPSYLLLLGSADAVQITIILSVVMSLFHVPKLKADIPFHILKPLAIGCIIGFPFGLYLYSHIDFTILKGLVAGFVILISLQNAWSMWRGQNGKSDHKKSVLGIIGVASGILGACLAMPGPHVMAYLSRTNLSKDEIRATMISLFVFAYVAILLLQMAVIGISRQTWIDSSILIPAALFGVYVGHQVSKLINERFFRGIVLIILIVTGITILLNL